MTYILVGIGGALGSLTRFSLGKLLVQGTQTSYLMTIFFINISGALLLGFVSSLDLPNGALLLMGNGFLGAYTTFSTFMYEGFHLFSDNRKNAAAYMGGAFILGILGYMLGFAVGSGTR